jgi:hypothetical protein
MRPFLLPLLIVMMLPESALRAEPASSAPSSPASAKAAPRPPADQDAVPGAGEKRLEEASVAYRELRLDDARIALDRALRDPSNSRARLVDIYRIKGVVEASMDQPIAAKRAFAHMLVLDPEASLSDELSPKILSTLEAARASLPGERGITLESAAPEEVLMEQPAELAIRINDTLGLVEQLQVRYRVDGGKWKRQVLSRADRGVLKIPATSLPARAAPYSLELEAVAQNAFGASLAELGPDNPGARLQVVAALSEPSKPLYEEWWLWAAVAGGVAISASAAGLLVWALAPPDTSPRDIGVSVE